MVDRFTAHKMAWIEQVTRDDKLGHFAARVGVIIASHLNRETGEAFPGQERIARLTGASTRQVQRALKELAARLHVAVEVRHGPNQSSRYRPLMWAKNLTPVSPIQDRETRRQCRLSEGGKATNTVTRTRHPCRPNPLKEPIGVIRQADSAIGTLPEGFPSQELIDLSHQKFMRESLQIDPRLCAEKFRAYYAGNTCANWPSRWETWVVREIEHTLKTMPPGPGPRKNPAHAPPARPTPITADFLAQRRAMLTRRISEPKAMGEALR